MSEVIMWANYSTVGCNNKSTHMKFLFPTGSAWKLGKPGTPLRNHHKERPMCVHVYDGRRWGNELTSLVEGWLKLYGASRICSVPLLSPTTSICCLALFFFQTIILNPFFPNQYLHAPSDVYTQNQARDARQNFWHDDRSCTKLKCLKRV